MSKLSKLVGYFDLRQNVLPKLTTGNERKSMKVVEQILLYLGILIGVFFSDFVMEFEKDVALHFEISVTKFIVSSIITIVIVPLVYEKLDVDPRAPFIVQFGLFVQNGFFWRAIIGAIQ
jgi:hypothetical protein